MMNAISREEREKKTIAAQVWGGKGPMMNVPLAPIRTAAYAPCSQEKPTETGQASLINAYLGAKSLDG